MRKILNLTLPIAITFFILGNAQPSLAQQASTVQAEPAPVQSAKLGSTKNVHSVGDLYLSGQFEASDLDAIKAAGIKRVVTLRCDGEVDWDEQKLIEEGGLKFKRLGFREPETLTPEVFETANKLLAEAALPDNKTLLHCGSANRVAAVWLVHRVLADKVPLPQAAQEATTIGLRTLEYEQSAVDFIRAKQPSAVPDHYRLVTKETSVRPGINKDFLSPDLDPQDWISKFEIESREIYGARNEILRACGIQPGWRIADIGAGTGIYTRLFANQTGPGGWVYAVDIAPRMIQHIAEQADTNNDRNVTAILCQQDSTNLPPDSIDFAFICDTFHHFEYPKSTLASLHAALKPDASLVVVDFKRIEGTSRPWTIEHVRAGQEVFTAEIEAAGFERIEEVAIPGLEENYFLRFRRK